MKILFTGASSFTGMWFVEALAKEGHEVMAIFQKEKMAYSGVRRLRVERLLPLCCAQFSCSFGSEAFLRLIGSEPHWDLLCHHAAEVGNYKSQTFDPNEALKNNTHGLTRVLPLLKQKGCQRILLTGSVFEPGEGAGSEPLAAVSPYGLSKGLTSNAFQEQCAREELSLGKFVIPNPFGPYEEKKFTYYLMQEWVNGRCAKVQHPEYVRDNIPVSLLAAGYCAFARSLPDQAGFVTTNPSWKPESQGDFTQRYAENMRKRLRIPCDFTLLKQTEFQEPLIRINQDRLDPSALNWEEETAWDEIAAYYTEH